MYPEILNQYVLKQLSRAKYQDMEALFELARCAGIGHLVMLPVQQGIREAFDHIRVFPVQEKNSAAGSCFPGSATDPYTDRVEVPVERYHNSQLRQVPSPSS